MSGYELIGIEKLPAEGPALLIYYHGALPLDMYYILARLILCKKRRVRNVAATFLFQIPGLIFLDREFVTFVWINYIIIYSNLKVHIYILNGLEEHYKSSYPSVESIPAVSKTIVLDHVMYYIIIIIQLLLLNTGISFL